MAAIGPVDIVNRALIKLGESVLIASLSDNSNPARLAKTSYDILRRDELRLNNWNFARVRTSISYLTDGAGNPIVPNWLYNLTYQLPSNCLRVLSVSDIFNGLDLSEYRNQDTREYVVEGDKILTNMTGNASFGVPTVVVPTTPSPVPLPILYIADVTDTSKFDAGFVEALACKLAMELAESLTQSLPKRQQATSEYNTAVRQARSVGACENPSAARPDNTWLMSRVS